MNGIAVFAFGFITGVVLIIVAACISVGSKPSPIHFKKSAEIQPKKISGFNSIEMNRCVLNDTIFYLLVYYMSGFMTDDEIKAYLINAIKIGINKDYIMLTKKDTSAEIIAQLLYEDIMKEFKEESK